MTEGSSHAMSCSEIYTHLATLSVSLVVDFAAKGQLRQLHLHELKAAAEKVPPLSVCSSRWTNVEGPAE